VRTLHVGLRVADLERALAFYTSLGYEVVGEVPATEFGSLTMLKLPSDEFVGLELVHDPARGHVDPGGLNHIVIKVEAMGETIAHLASRGVDAEPPSSPMTPKTSGRPGSRIQMAIASSWSSGPPGIPTVSPTPTLTARAPPIDGCRASREDHPAAPRRLVRA